MSDQNSRLFVSETEYGISFVEWYYGRVAGAVFISNDGYVNDEENGIDECTFAHGGYQGKAIDYLVWSPSWTETTDKTDRDFYMTALFCLKEGEPKLDRTPTKYEKADDIFSLTPSGKKYLLLDGSKMSILVVSEREVDQDEF